MNCKSLFILSLFVLTFSVKAQLNISEASAEIVFDTFKSENDSVINAGVLVTLEKDWHIYWRNPGDSGMPTSFEFEVPHEIKLTEIKWPIPKIFEFDGFASYGYEEKVLFPFQIFLPEEKTFNSFEIKLKIKSLICKDVCKPFNTEVKQTFDIRKNYNPSKEINELFVRTASLIPEKNDLINLTAKSDSEKVLITFNSSRINAGRIKVIHFIPFENGLFKNSLNQKFSKINNSIELIIEYDQYRIKTPELVEGILLIEINSEEGNKKIGYEIIHKIEIIKNLQ
jgi:thiol:disulfide interchange protein DsbD